MRKTCDLPLGTLGRFLYLPERGRSRRVAGKSVGLGGGCNERSIMILLQISRRVFAMVRAGASQRKTWHMCLRVARSRATYAKSLWNKNARVDESV